MLARATTDGILRSLVKWSLIMLVGYGVGVTVLRVKAAYLSNYRTEKMIEYKRSLSPEKQAKFPSDAFCFESPGDW